MAPIYTSATGISPQVLDDPILAQLVHDLKALPWVIDVETLEALTELLEPQCSTGEWPYDETVDLFDWIHPLNVMDSALTWILKNYSQNLLLLPSFGQPKEYPAATSLAEIQQCPASILRHAQVILQFSSLLLRHATSKHLYASVGSVADLMAAADDVLSDAAVATLTALSVPPAMHALPGAGGDPPMLLTQLHQSQSQSKTDVQDRLLCTARAWGSRALGLGLRVTVAADDSPYGQGALPVELGEVRFAYTPSAGESSKKETSLLPEEICLTVADMQLSQPDGMYTSSSPSPDHSVASSPRNEGDADGSSTTMTGGASKKRRKVTSVMSESNASSSSSTQYSKKRMRSTAELFFLAVERANDGRLESIPTDRWFSLLAEIRLARSFHSQADRHAAVARRLLALTAVLNSHPFNDVMTGYFEAQPELCVDIVDLLRPLVSAASVSAVSDRRDVLRPDAVENLVSDTVHDGVPFALRVAALEALTALVSRRENSSSQISGYGRLASVLSDLGVGKGQYLGLLPTLLRYSLAALGSVMDSTSSSVDEEEHVVAASDAFSIGLAFVEATSPPPISRKLQSVRALRFIDRMLTLTNAVVGSSQGLAALVDCGLIPALLTTVSLHPEEALRGLVRGDEVFSAKEMNRIRASLRLITAQALHILETVTVAHPNSMVTFHDLNGVDILLNRLSWEIADAKKNGEKAVSENDMDVEDSDTAVPKQKLSSQRVVIFCILTCLTAVFHQDSSNSDIAPLGGIQLRKPAFTEVLLEILNHVPSYGGHLVSLVSSLLSDIMNGDPHVVHYVVSCGLADSFLQLVVGEKTIGSDGVITYVPTMPPCAELVMAIPNVIAALSLTEDGAKLVKDRNPFPCFLRLLYHPDYAMPRSRCLLNEMTSIIGTGLDEIVRHVEILKPLVVAAIAEGMDQVIMIANHLLERENRTLNFAEPILDPSIEQERSCLIQYILNFAQLLEQFLHNDENCEPFVEAGGLDSVLRFFPLSMPPPGQFLSYVSSMSSPAVSTLLHSTTEEALNGVCKSIEMRYDSLKLLRKLVVIAEHLFVQLDEIMSKLASGSEDGLNFMLDVLPLDPLYVLTKSESQDFLLSVSQFLRTVSSIQWITSLIGNALKAKSGESSWSRVETEWKSEVAGESFGRLIDRIGAFHRASLFEVCRVRAEKKFEETERTRNEKRSSRLRYLLRIVCTEGAVVRDGIEIDLCANVGSLEMGDIVESFDRCVNSSGILRYRTRSGWVSEMTRGHGREPIAEVIRVWECDDESKFDCLDLDRVEMGVLGLRSVAVSVLARGQASSAELFGALSKLVVQGVRTLPLPLSFDEGSAGACVASLTKVLVDNLKQSLQYEPISETVSATLSEQASSDLQISEGGGAMYLAAVLNQLHACLFDEKRERRIVNVPLLLSLVVLDSDDDRGRVQVSSELNTGAMFFQVVGFIFRHGLTDSLFRHGELDGKEVTEPDHLRTSRSVASSFPPVISLLRKLSSTPMTSSPVASIMSRLKWKDISLLLGMQKIEFVHIGAPDCDDFFHPESFVADLMLSLSSCTRSVWCDERIRFVPPYLVHPLSGLVGDVMVLLEDLSKKKPTKGVPSASDRMRLSDLLRLRPSDAENQPFEVSEDSVTRLVEMGFTTEHARHALESTRSNSLETAMEYALENDLPTSIGGVHQREEINEATGVRESRSGLANDVDENIGNTSLVASTSDGSADVTMKDNESSITFDVLAKVELRKWICLIPDVVCDMLNHIPYSSQRTPESPRGVDKSVDTRRGDPVGECETLTVVLCSFLSELLHKYPEGRVDAVSLILSKLKENISKSEGGTVTYFIDDKRYVAFGALCHASVILIRALPKCRLLVLKVGLVGQIVSCMCSAFSSISSVLPTSENRTLPHWMTSAFLFLEVMAQPIVAFSEEDTLDADLSLSQENEYVQVKSQHCNHKSEISGIVDRWIAFSHTSGSEQSPNLGDASSIEEESLNMTNGGTMSLKSSLFSKVPTYFPLIPAELSQDCLSICQEILFKCRDFSVAPSMVHGALLLLLRLVRSPLVASHCLKAGFAEAILSLPKESFFVGNSSLITLILRRLLEDEPTLLSAMEAEIRNAITKLHAKVNPPKDELPKISLKSFIEGTTHILCREPTVFFKAMTLVVAIEPPSRKTSENEAVFVTLLAPSVRSRMREADVLLKCDIVKDVVATQQELYTDSKEKDKVSNRFRNSSSGKKGRKEKTESPLPKKVEQQKSSVIESPTLRVCGLLIDSIITSASSLARDIYEDQFLSTDNLLDILSELVLALPACASAVHNHRPFRSKEKSRKSSSFYQVDHALLGCSTPPRSFVTFLLHFLLPQDRWSIRNDPQLWERQKDVRGKESTFIRNKKKKAHRILKVSQNAGRLLFALVLRPGEGRKRLIADIVFALSGGLLGHGATSPFTVTKANQGMRQGSNSELHALLAWGELCLAVAAPKSNGKNLDGLSTFSMDSIRLMLESGMVHALLFAFRRTGIGHPMSSSTYGALLLPLEVLTRVTVTDSIESLVKKEAEPMDVQESLAKDASPIKVLALDSSIIDDEFSSQVNVCHEHHGNLGVAFDVLVDVDSSEGDSHDEDDEMADEDDESSESSNSDEESGEGHNDESVNESENDDMEDDDEDSDESDDASNESHEVDDDDGWNVDNHNSFAADDHAVEDDDDDDDEEVTEGLDEAGLDEGWTRIDSNGFGGMLTDRNLRTGFVVDGELRSRGFMDMSMTQARGFVESAEAMINSLFRNEDISGEALAELEGTLGIRIMRGRGTRAGVNDRSLVDVLGSRLRGNRGEDVASADRGSRNDVVGSVPRVYQRSQPVVGHSGFGRNVPWLEVSAMEYVFGGPSLTCGSRYYDGASGEQSTFDLDDEARFTHLDLQIFPGGAISAISFRTQRNLHPLLSGVDLPPMNSLVSDVSPQRSRVARPGQMLSRPPNPWSSSFASPLEGFFVSSSNGNIVRSNRPFSGVHSAVGTSERINPIVLGWSDDGVIIDSAVQEFSSSLETILDQRARDFLNDVVAPPVGADSTAVQENTAENAQTDESSNLQHGESEPLQRTSSATASTQSDGDGVTSSVAGLHLSSENEPTVDVNFQGINGAGSLVGENFAPSLDALNDTTSLQGGPNLSVAVLSEQSALPSNMPVDSSTDALDAMPSNEADVENVTEDPASNANLNGLVCPPDIDVDVFNSLPQEMQQDCVDQYRRTQELVAQLTGSTLDPEVLAALPEDMRREIIEQDRQERRLRDQEQEQADPSNAEEMDNASFLASLSPDLREEILLTADEAFLSSLPPGVVAEAHILRERATVLQRRQYEAPRDGASNRDSANPGSNLTLASEGAGNVDSNGLAFRKKHRIGKLKVEKDRNHVSYFPQRLSSPFAVADLKALISSMFMLSPIQPARLLQKVFVNLCSNAALRSTITSTLIYLLREDSQGTLSTVESYSKSYEDSDVWKIFMDQQVSTHDFFPPSSLLGTLPEIPVVEGINTKQGTGAAVSLAANLPKYSRGGSGIAYSLPPVIAARLVDTMLQLCKIPKICLHTLTGQMVGSSSDAGGSSCFENLLDLLDKPMFAKSANNLEQLLTLFEVIVAPLSQVSRNQKSEDSEVSEREIENAASAGKEYVDVPDVVISQRRLQLLCSILRMETCMDATFTKVNTIIRRLCRVETNRGFVLSELASVAHALGCDAVRDLKALRIRMESAASRHETRQNQAMEIDEAVEDSNRIDAVVKRITGSQSSSVTLSTSTSETKLLRVLQTLQVLCSDGVDDVSLKKNENSVLTTEELVHILRQLKFDDLWGELSTCLKVVQVLEGVKSFEEEEQKVSESLEAADDGSTDDIGGKKKKLRNSAAGLLTRFLPIIEAFFVANACGSRPPPSDLKNNGEDDTGEITIESLVGGQRLLEFVTSHRILINALVRNNPGLLDKGLRALVQVPRFRVLLDFDVKRQWFKSQVRRLRQQASRRHGSLRLHIRRKSVFEDAYHQLQPRNADEMRGRLHVTFRNEEGVDAGGLSREFFGILAKEMFNPNYALFTSTEDGCTFQPNPNSMINPDHLSYFRFVGRVVGKAVADGFLLDAHFTRSLYKHMLGVQPTHHDMEAIDPDYYRNLKTILEFNLADIGLDLTFSIEDHSFGRSQVIDLIPNGRSVPVTEENKEEYVRLVCQHRMTTSIQSQIKSYLAGFYELVSPELIAIFTPRELELLISGLPDIDVHDLKKNTDYVGWKATDKEIVWFWNVLFSLNRNEKASFLQFVTGSSKVPLSGFAELQGMRGIQKFSIHKTGGTKGALMSAHTCFNSLDLPKYDSEEEMREKLLYAINEGGGGFLFA